jgi:hypothetical protein
MSRKNLRANVTCGQDSILQTADSQECAPDKIGITRQVAAEIGMRWKRGQLSRQLKKDLGLQGLGRADIERIAWEQITRKPQGVAMAAMRKQDVA